jgi:hypothetical protein
MDLLPENSNCKPSSAQRDHLPYRREAETIASEHRGAGFTMTTGRYEDGRLGEVFINAGHANSALDAIISDAAIAISLALQFGCPLDTLSHAMKRDSSGTAASPIGAALDKIIP